MRLVIFDIDGTLTRTMQADAECFVRSLSDVFGYSGVDTDWSHYQHATDAGVFHEIYEARVGRPPSLIEISRFRRHFVDLLARASSEAPFTAVAGASVLLSRLASDAEHRVALATGAWRDSARLKMASAGLCYDDYPAASCDDALDRETIVRLSMQRAAERTELLAAPFTSATAFGMPGRAVGSAFRLSALPRTVRLHVWPLRERFASTPTLPTRICS